MLDRLSTANTDLQEFLSNKRKLRSEKSVHFSSSQCGQAWYRLVTVHSIHCCLGAIPTTSPLNQQSVFNRLSIQTSEKPKSQKKKTTKVLRLTTASISMINRGRIYFSPNKGDKGLILLQLAPWTLAPA